MTQPLIGFLAFAVGIVVVAIAPVVAVWLIMQILKGLGFVIGGTFKIVGGGVRHVGRFVKGEIVDSLQFAGSLLTAGVVVPLAVANLGLARFRAARHYGGAAEDEVMNALACLYRVGLGHPVRFLGLGALTDGLERRLPKLLEEEPRTGDARRTATGGLFGRRRRSISASAASRGDALRRGEQPAFEGYEVQEELRPGGSGARLFAAVPNSDRVADLQARGLHVPAKVVIKAFALGYGSTIPQIVRESRSLEAAKRLGLVLDHAIDEDAFHYVMPFVPGDDLDTTTRALHAAFPKDGLQPDQLRTVLGYARDLCDHLGRFHGEGLWHKDIKPSNLMVTGSRLQVVDFGLVTPLESALTLTTHGTEFFRDPELVRLALAGKRVKDVDGVKFDLYSAGAVLYSMVENSFPAHGSLSSITKPAPGALRWIVRRAMADIDKRYASAEELGRDLDVLIAAKTPYEVRPADLPSVSGAEAPRRARKAAFTPSPSADERGSDEDVRRFEAFGMAAEVHGLGRMRSTMRAARDEHRAKRAHAKSERDRIRQEKVTAKEESRLRRRKRGRGVLKAIVILFVFAAIGGGLQEMKHAKAMDDRARFVHSFQELPPNLPIPTFPGLDQAALHSSLEDELAALEGGSRVLLVADPGDVEVSVEADRIARRLRDMGLSPVGFAGDQGATLDLDNVSLLSEALHALEVRPRGQSTRRCLDEFLAENEDLGGVMHLSANQPGGRLRAVLETAGRRTPRSLSSRGDACVSSTCEDADCTTSCSTSECETSCDEARESVRRVLGDSYSGACSSSSRVSQ